MKMFFSRSSTISAIVFFSVLLLGVRGKRVKRVSGGVPAKSRHDKYTVGIFAGRSAQYEGVWMCGGAIISDHHVLTAAVCLADFEPAELSVVPSHGIKEFGKYNSYMYYAAKELIKHPNYKPTCSECEKLIAENNIGLILLDKSMSSELLNELSQQLYLPYYQVQINERCSLVGVESTNALEMHVIEQSLVDLEKCENPGNTKNKSHVSQYVCAENGFANACMNDIGSPLVHNGYIVGVLSVATCEPGGSTTYSNVYLYSYWIFTQISS